MAIILSNNSYIGSIVSPCSTIAQLDMDSGLVLLICNKVQGPVRLLQQSTGVPCDLISENHVVHSHQQTPQQAERVHPKQDILCVEFQGPIGTRPTRLDRPLPRYLKAVMFQPQGF